MGARFQPSGTGRSAPGRALRLLARTVAGDLLEGLGHLLDAGEEARRALRLLRLLAPVGDLGDGAADGPRPVGEDPDAVAEVAGLGHRVRDHEDRRLLVRPQLADEVLHVEAGGLVEGAERLV